MRQVSSGGGTSRGVHPLLQKAEVEGLRSQLADLRAQLREYEGVRAGRRRLPPVDGLDELPRSLVQARIAAGLAQQDLADRLGLKAQQIQRYEATGYASASLTRLRQIAAGISGRPAPRRRMRDAR